MVKQGFALFDLKTLYIDEFSEYYSETIRALELSGDLPEGSYDKLKGIDRTSENLASLFKQAKATKQ
jgi:hypothetical protein